jgi:two-component system response regulator PilR (NtrC family)
MEGHRGFARSGIDLEIPIGGIDLEEAVENLEKTLILKALEKAQGIKKRAADLLHINFRSMRYRLEKYGLNNSDL